MTHVPHAVRVHLTTMSMIAMMTGSSHSWHSWSGPMSTHGRSTVWTISWARSLMRWSVTHHHVGRHHTREHGSRGHSHVRAWHKGTGTAGRHTRHQRQASWQRHTRTDNDWSTRHGTRHTGTRHRHQQRSTHIHSHVVSQKLRIELSDIFLVFSTMIVLLTASLGVVC